MTDPFGTTVAIVSAVPAATSTRRRGPIEGSYDAARSDGMNKQHWSYADALDPSLANSKAVRATLVNRSRYELANNGHGAGILRTHAGYVVGRGPKLRMQTAAKPFNKAVELAWCQWARQVKLSRKLRTACRAKVRDGEPFLIVRNNPALRGPVQIDLVGIECEQCQSPYGAWRVSNKVDGIEFDDFGNPTVYEVLRYHPGSEWSGLNADPERIPARFVLHWYTEDRFGQHRAVPELTPSLGLFAVDRRYREATVVAAENIANLSILLKTQSMPSDGPDEYRPFTAFPFEKGMLTQLPYGMDAYQPRPEQPGAQYEMFTRSQTTEEARPLCMPYGIAAGDNSGMSFSGGKLDHLGYFDTAVDVDQDDAELLVLDPLFALWFAESCRTYGWAADPDDPPAHTWDWPARPKIDDQKTAAARQIDLSTGVASLRRLYAEDGRDFEDELADLAEDYGVTPDRMREILLQVNLLSRAGAAASPAPTAAPGDDADDAPPQPPPRNRLPARNGNANGKARV